MSEQDEQWFDALAGHRAPATAQDAQLQQALRQAAAYDASPQRDELAEQRLLRRLEAEGLLPSFQAARPSRIRPRLAQVAVVVLCVGVVLQWMDLPQQLALQPAANKQDQMALGQAELEPEGRAVPQSQPRPDASLYQAPPSAEQSFSAPSGSRERRVQAAPSAPKQSPYSAEAHKRKPAALADQAPAARAESQTVAFEFSLQVNDLAAALTRLQAWQVQDSPSPTPPAEVVSLRCDNQTDCDQLLGLLQRLDDKLEIKSLPVAQTLHVQLQVQP